MTLAFMPRALSFPFLSALVAATLVTVAGCASTGVYRTGDVPASLPSETVAFTVFLTGNTADFKTDAVLSRIGLEAGAAGEQSAVVLLGDLEGADATAALASALRGYQGRVIAVPGDRDERTANLADRLSQSLGLEVEGPGRGDEELNEIELTETLRLVALDTPWWLEGVSDDQAWHPADAATALERLILDRDDEQLIIVGHHPMESNGAYGGSRTFFRGLSTLGVAPLLSPTVGLTSQDLASPSYRQFTRALSSAFGNHERLVYAGASDRSLQAFSRGVNGGRAQQTLLVSGTGGGGIGAAQGGYGAAFVAPRPGFWRLTYYADGSLWSEAVALEDGQATVLYRSELAEADAELAAELAPPPSVTGPVEAPTRVTQALDAGFESGPFRNNGLTRFFAGAGYRDAWGTPVDLEVVDLGALGGGLTPLRRGGGNQTTGLRLEGEDGHVYEFRLIEKGGIGGLPQPLRDGFAGDLVLDLRSAALPYAAVVTADLVTSAGLYTSQPRVMYVPDDPRLGIYREDFGDRIALVEVRPDDDMSDLEGWEGVTDVVSSGKLREEIAEDQDHRVDERAFFRARLLDLMVGDWDRHAGQWRWAAFEPGELDPSLEGDDATKGKVYQPIPRDRDWAFYDLEGVAQRALFQFDRRYQSYDEDSYGSILGLTANARGQDRRFMSTITREEAISIGNDLQARLTDAAIDRAIAKLPPEILAEVGDEWRNGLRQRRDDLEYAAERLYGLAAQVVDVVGSDERERFAVVPAPGGGVTVTVESFKKGEVGLELYRRTFVPGETEEIRLYGRGGRDQFDIAPDADAISVRVIGGSGLDTVSSEESDVALYDTPGGVEVEGRVSDHTSDDPGVNRYSEDERIVPLFVSAPVVGASATDGVILGASVTKTSYGFRLNPYASQQTIAADVATGTGGIRASYNGHFVDAAGPFDVRVGLLGALPRNVRNFYGLGNETVGIENDLVRLDLALAHADVSLELPLGIGAMVSAGPTVRYADPSRDENLLQGPLASLPEIAYEPQSHAGGVGRLRISTVDTPGNPKQGVRLDLEGAALAGIAGEAESYGTVGGTLAAFVPVRLVPQLTLALRAGGSHRIGAFPFFDAAVIGQSSSVRGFRRERFAGRSSAFGNAELRVKLFELPTYLVPFDVGMLAFADAGRVWISSGADVAGVQNPIIADGDEIHLGYGGGLWFGVLDRAALVLTVQSSVEETLASFGVGFHF